MLFIFILKGRTSILDLLRYWLESELSVRFIMFSPSAVFCGGGAGCNEEY